MSKRMLCSHFKKGDIIITRNEEVYIIVTAIYDRNQGTSSEFTALNMESKRERRFHCWDRIINKSFTSGSGGNSDDITHYIPLEDYDGANSTAIKVGE